MSIIKNNQSTFDVSTQINGDVKSVVDFCIKNNLPITEDVPAGTPYEVADTVHVNELVSEYFFNKSYELTTSEPKSLSAQGGIGVMIVESDFIVIT